MKKPGFENPIVHVELNQWQDQGKIVNFRFIPGKLMHRARVVVDRTEEYLWPTGRKEST